MSPVCECNQNKVKIFATYERYNYLQFLVMLRMWNGGRMLASV